MAEFFPIAVDAPLDFGGVVVPAFLVRKLGPDGQLAFHPLFGGIDPAVSWKSLRLFETAVLPMMKAKGMI